MNADRLPPAPHPAVIGSVVLGAAPVKVIASIQEAQTEDVLAAQKRLEKEPLDLIEWRADHFAGRTLLSLERTAQELAKRAKRPVLFTMRSSAEGGLRDLTQRDYKEVGVIIAKNGRLPAIDVEISRGRSALRILEAAHENRMTAVASFHDFSGTPSGADLDGVFARMHRAGADVLKVAVMPRRPEDVLVLMGSALRARREYGRPVIAMAMGELGVVTRVCGSLFGSDATFASAGRPSAPGQVALAELRRLLDFFA